MLRRAQRCTSATSSCWSPKGLTSSKGSWNATSVDLLEALDRAPSCWPSLCEAHGPGLCGTHARLRGSTRGPCLKRLMWSLSSLRGLRSLPKQAKPRLSGHMAMPRRLLQTLFRPQKKVDPVLRSRAQPADPNLASQQKRHDRWTKHEEKIRKT